MSFYKGTQQECENYDDEVVLGENYESTTINWAPIYEIEGDYYIMKAEPPFATKEYLSTMMEVQDLPETNQNYANS